MDRFEVRPLPPQLLSGAWPLRCSPPLAAVFVKMIIVVAVILLLLLLILLSRLLPNGLLKLFLKVKIMMTMMPALISLTMPVQQAPAAGQAANLLRQRVMAAIVT